MIKAFLLILYCTVVHIVSAETSNRYTLSALDCRNPSKIRSGLWSDLCTTNSNHTLPDERSFMVTILQYDDSYLLNALRCSKYATTHLYYCGRYSHLKLFALPAVKQKQPFGIKACQNIAKHAIYEKEDGSSVPLEASQRLEYGYLPHGQIERWTTNTACNGARLTFGGEQFDQVLPVVSTTVYSTKVKVEVSKDTIVDLDSHEKLPYQCSKDYTCQPGGEAYILEKPKTTCPLYKVRSIEVQQKVVLLDGKPAKALVNTDHKIFLIVKGNYNPPRNCYSMPAAVYDTNYAEVKVVFHNGKFVSRLPQLSESELDMDLEARITDEFMTYESELRMHSRLGDVANELCKLSQFGITENELSPFSEDALFRVRGELIQELLCSRVTVSTTAGYSANKKCYNNLLPVMLGSEPVFLESRTRMVIKTPDMSEGPCERNFLPVFVTTDRQLLIASPEITELKIPLQTEAFDFLGNFNADRNHMTFSQNLLYTHDEISSFNHLLHFSRSKDRVVDLLTESYCAGGDCNDLAPTGSGTKPFDLSRLSEDIANDLSIWHKIQSFITEYGSYSGFLLGILWIANFVQRLITWFNLYFYQKMHLGESIALTFNVNSLMRDRLAPQNNVEPRVYYNQNRADSSRSRATIETIASQRGARASDNRALHRHDFLDLLSLNTDDNEQRISELE